MEILGSTTVFMLAQVPDHSQLGDAARIAAALALACLVHRGVAYRLPQIELRFLVNAAACCVAMVLSLSPVLPLFGLACYFMAARLRRVGPRRHAQA